MPAGAASLLHCAATGAGAVGQRESAGRKKRQNSNVLYMKG